MDNTPHQTPVHQPNLEVRVAILETQMARLLEDVTKGFASIEKKIDCLQDRNSVAEFIRQNWKVVVVFGILTTGAPAAELLKTVMPLLTGGAL